MWSPAFVPKPKDWPDHVDIVGTFFDTAILSATDTATATAAAASAAEGPSSNNEGTISIEAESIPSPGTEPGTGVGSPSSPFVQLSSLEFSEPEPESTSFSAPPLQSPATARGGQQRGPPAACVSDCAQAAVLKRTHAAAAATGEKALAECKTPVSPAGEQHFTPSAELLRFLGSPRATATTTTTIVSNGPNTAATAPVFVGFGSMVLDNAEEVISLFLQAAALANVRLLVQVGWSSGGITPERFSQLAAEAERKATAVTEMLNSSEDSFIFPSTTTTAAVSATAVAASATAAVTAAATAATASASDVATAALTAAAASAVTCTATAVSLAVAASTDTGDPESGGLVPSNGIEEGDGGGGGLSLDATAPVSEELSTPQESPLVASSGATPTTPVSISFSDHADNDRNIDPDSSSRSTADRNAVVAESVCEGEDRQSESGSKSGGGGIGGWVWGALNMGKALGTSSQQVGQYISQG